MFLFIEHPPPAELRLVVHALANTITAKTSIKYIFFFIELVCVPNIKLKKMVFGIQYPLFCCFKRILTPCSHLNYVKFGVNTLN
jgi:hypothetical protein